MTTETRLRATEGQVTEERAILLERAGQMHAARDLWALLVDATPRGPERRRLLDQVARLDARTLARLRRPVARLSLRTQLGW